ncbi:MAG: transcriptional regulator [Acidobacteria bacterium]|nr:transcriptional regulator [Acidobacteriota bacterium]TDI35986.1 MAG: transcriptional regulator [Acidobacteriota bacterium]TDI51674.1 MAG: transcriptional regulator [Acidobacteriota bacterium]
MTYSSSFSKAQRKETYRRLGRVVRGSQPTPLLSFNELRVRLHLFQQSYAGLRTIEVARIVGTVDRSDDFDRDFLPRNPQTRERWERLERAFPTLGFPPISVYQVNDVFFVIDGNHRVALAKQKGAEFIDAEVTQIHTDIEIDENIDFEKMFYLEQARRFMQESGLERSRPMARIDFTRPHGFIELLDVVKAHGYDLMMERGEVLQPHEIAADWYDRVYLPAVESIRWERLLEIEPGSTEGDLFLWVLQRRREHDPQQGQPSLEDAARQVARDQERRIRVRARRALGRG